MDSSLVVPTDAWRRASGSRSIGTACTQSSRIKARDTFDAADGGTILCIGTSNAIALLVRWNNEPEIAVALLRTSLRSSIAPS